MTVDFKEYSRRMDKALEHLDEEFASVVQAAPTQRFSIGSPWNTMAVKRP